LSFSVEGRLNFDRTSTVNSLQIQVSLDTLVPCIFGVVKSLHEVQNPGEQVSYVEEGLRFGTAAVEMGLHRLAALGGGRRASPGDDSSVPFVTFAGSLPVPGDCVNGTVEVKPRTLGF
jgi:hypothetical protein